MLKLTLTHSRLRTLKLVTANFSIIALAMGAFAPVAYADTKAPVDRSDLLPVVVSGTTADSTQNALDKLQQLAVSEQPAVATATVTTALPQLERDDFWATSQSTLDKIAEKKREAKLKAAAKKRKVEQAKKMLALATAPTSVIQSYAHQQVLAKGWGEGDFTCLVNLWNKESGWNPKAENTSSGAYGIPQALPGSKMATVGANWRSDYRVQINWGLGYIASSYGTPCSAWAHSQATNWY